MKLNAIPKYALYGDGDMQCVKEEEFKKLYPNTTLYVKLSDLESKKKIITK